MPVTDSIPSLLEALPPLRPDQEGSPGLWELARLALDSLATNKLRSALTMLGVIIGVAAVSALLSLGAAVNEAITGELRRFGTHTLVIFPSWPPTMARNAAFPQLSQADADAIASLGLPLAGLAVQGGLNARLVAPSADTEAYLLATTPIWAELSAIRMAQGSFFDEAQLREAAPVIVLGAELKRRLFGQGEAMGQTVRVLGQPLQVIGVQALRGGLDSDPDNTAIIPITLAQQRLGAARASDGKPAINGIVVAVRPDADLEWVQAALTTFLRERHRLKPDGSADDFRVQSMAAQLEQANTILNVLTLFLGSVAGISLLVGGIGIMNIMLVSVTERTREIGLRKAVGARGWDLLWQFLVEALVLSVTGGAIGLGLAAVLALIVTATGLLKVPVTPQSVALALGFSLAVGLFFGLYPAQRAARLNPIDALRFE